MDKDVYVIPLEPNSNQEFTCELPIDGKKLKLFFFLRYNTESKCWEMNINDSNNNPLICSIPLVSGLNILEQYSYLNIGSAYLVRLNNNLNTSRPNEFNLGKDFILVWSDTK
ncbi:hypothetical protein FDE94_15150 [Clostridium botulinum]|nr:hypothetical protein [Clostridium botulinum]